MKEQASARLDNESSFPFFLVSLEPIRTSHIDFRDGPD